MGSTRASRWVGWANYHNFGAGESVLARVGRSSFPNARLLALLAKSASIGVGGDAQHRGVFQTPFLAKQPCMILIGVAKDGTNVSNTADHDTVHGRPREPRNAQMH